MLYLQGVVVADIPTPEEVQAAVAAYRADPVSDQAMAAGVVVMDYARRSSELYTNLPHGAVPWLDGDASDAVRSDLLLAWTVGAVAWRLDTPAARDGSAAQYCAAFDQVFATYARMRQVERKLRVEELRPLLRLRARGGLATRCRALTRRSPSP